MFECAAELPRGPQRLIDRQPVTFRLPQLPLEVASGHVLGDDVLLSRLLADVVDCDDMGVIPEARHRLSLAPHAHQAVGVEAFCLDDGKGDIAI